MSQIPEIPEESEVKLTYHQRLQKTRSQLAEAERSELEEEERISTESESSFEDENQSDSGEGYLDGTYRLYDCHTMIQ